MKKEDAIILAYQIATLDRPTEEILDVLARLEYERVLELLLILRQSPREVKSPVNFLRRAIAEGWTAETIPEKLNRKEQNILVRGYVRRGASQEEADARALQSQRRIISGE